MIGGQMNKQGGGGTNEKTNMTAWEDNREGGNREGFTREGGTREGGDHTEGGVMMVQGMTLQKETFVPRDVRKLLAESTNPLFVLYEEFGHLIPELGKCPPSCTPPHSLYPPSPCTPPLSL